MRIVFFILLCLCRHSIAQELSPVIVSEGYEQDETQSHYQLNSSDFKDTPELSSIIQNTPGLQVLRNGASGLNEVFSLRARPSYLTQVYIDEFIINKDSSNSFNLADWDARMFSQIDIFANSSTRTMGSGRGGGAINLKLQDISKAYIGVGSFGQLSLGGSHQTKDTLIGISFDELENNFSFTNDNATPLNKSDDYEDERSNASNRRVNYYIKHKLNKSWQFLLLGRDARKGVPDNLNSKTNRAYLREESNLLGVQFKKDNFRYQGQTQLEQATYDDTAASVGLGAKLYRYQWLHHYHNIFYEYQYDNHIFYSSMQLHQVGLDKVDEISRSSSDFSQLNNFSQLGVQSYKDKLMMSLELNHRHSNNDSNKNFEYIGQKLGASYVWSKNIESHFQIDNTARLPSISELYVDRGLSTNNVSLDFEKLINTELGASFKMDIHEFAINLFHQNYRDKIVWVFDSRGIGHPQNLLNSQNRGLELSYTLNMGAIYLNSSLTLQSSKVEQGVNKNNEIPGLSREMYSFSGAYKMSMADLGLNYNYNGASYLDSGNQLELNNYSKLDTWIKFFINDYVLSLSVNNILNEETNQMVNGFPDKGIGYYAQLSFRLKD